MSTTVTVLAPSPTPKTYHRIVSDTLIIPNDGTVPVPVGLLACQRDPLLRSLTTVVVSAQLAPAPPPPPAGKKQKKNVAPTTDATPLKPGKLWEVVLHDTVLFPEGGGQPSDVGLLAREGEADDSSAHWEVEEARRRGGIAVHFVRLPEGASLSAKERVRVWLGERGEERRLDHMSMHTAQHLLSALLESRLQLPTLSWALTAFPTPAYVELPRIPSPTELAALQKEAHALARAGAAVHVEVTELKESNVKAVDTVEVAPGKGREVGRGLPTDYTGGVNRVVVIDGVDRNPCCGTHLPSLASLELFLLPPSTASTGSTTGKLLFLAGPRLHAHLAASHAQLAAAAQLLSCGPALVPERLEQAIDERRRADKRGETLMLEVAGYVAAEIVSKGQVRGAYVQRVDEGSGSALLGAVAGKLEGESGALVVLVAIQPLQSATSTSFVQLVGADEAEVKRIGEALRKFGVKGGGKGKRWSGKFTGVWLDKREGASMRAVIEEVVGPSANTTGVSNES